MSWEWTKANPGMSGMNVWAAKVRDWSFVIVEDVDLAPGKYSATAAQFTVTSDGRHVKGPTLNFHPAWDAEGQRMDMNKLSKSFAEAEALCKKYYRSKQT